MQVFKSQHFCSALISNRRIMLKVTWLQIAAFCSIIVCLRSANEKHGENDHSSWETTSQFCSSKNLFRTFDKSKQYDTMLRQIKDDTFCKNSTCSQHSSCFLGSCPCHPGYGGKKCDMKLSVSNMWYTKHCPNLQQQSTLDIHVPLTLVGGEHPKTIDTMSEKRCEPPAHPKTCAYLCYSHNSYGTAIVPISLWKAAQSAEGNLWASIGSLFRIVSCIVFFLNAVWHHYVQVAQLPSMMPMIELRSIGRHSTISQDCK